jgi:hypothetical protein
MKCSFACIIAIAGWYLLYPPAHHKGNPDSSTAPSEWTIDGSYGSAADCDEAHQGDLNALQGCSRILAISSKPEPADVSRPTISAAGLVHVDAATAPGCSLHCLPPVRPRAGGHAHIKRLCCACS